MQWQMQWQIQIQIQKSIFYIRLLGIYESYVYLPLTVEIASCLAMTA
jgi:hypothetical protein